MLSFPQSLFVRSVFGNCRSQKWRGNAGAEKVYTDWKTIFPGVQSKSPLAQFEAISPLSLFFLQVKQHQLPQLLLRLVLHTLHHLCLLPFSGHTPAPQCLSCREDPKTEHRIWGVASPVASTGGWSLLAALLFVQAGMPWTCQLASSSNANFVFNSGGKPYAVFLI